MTTFAFSFKLQLGFPLLQKLMAVLGGMRKKKKKESDNHLVAAFPTRSNKDRLQDLQSDFPPFVLAKLSCNSEVEQRS